MRTHYSYIIISLCMIYTHVSFVNAQSYCTPNPTYGTAANIYIDGVQLGDINMTATGANPGPNYNDYTYYNTSLKRGSSYSLTITGSPYFSNMHYVAWIDYNQDGDFKDNNEKLGEFITTLANQKFNIGFTVPSLVTLNKTRLRVRAVWSVSNPDPCENYSYGETEDYSVTITDINKINTGIKGNYGQITTLNFDNDSDLDLFTMEEYFNDTVQFCYRNIGPSYSFYNLMPVNLPLLYSPTYTFADLNNDNILDGLFTGRDRTTEKPVTLMYRGNGTIINQFNSKITPLKRGATACADLNNDGKKDIIITGQDINNKYYTYIYQNYTDSFKLVEITNIPGLINGKIKCIDYDKDLDIDIFMSGSDKYGNKNAIIFKNNGDWTFTNINAQIDKISGEFVEWGDMNNDGRPDLVMDRYEGLKIYYNQGNDKFIEYTTIIKELECGIALGDFNNDGLMDIISQKADIPTIYLNATSNPFSEFIQCPVKGTTDPGIKGFEIGDFNLDNNLDIVVNADYITILENTNTKYNKKPTTPIGLTSTTHFPEYYSVTLKWNASTDDNMPSNALMYNIKIGTSIDGNNVLSSEVVLDTVLLLTQTGNVFQNTSWIVKNLAPGRYYWKVQAIDNAFNASSFSAYSYFDIYPPLTQAAYQFEGMMINQFPGFDFDGDNDMDVLIKKDTIKIYEQVSKENFKGRNIGLGITVIGISDLNNDNLPEIIFTKPDTLGFYLKNNDKTFERHIIDPKTTSAITANDFDNDGDMDIIAVQGPIYIYECTGLFTYTKKLIYDTDTFANFIYITSQDLDLDGDNDILISGPVSTSYNAKSKTITFLNKGNLNFEKYQDIYPGLGPLYFPTGAFTTYTAAQSISLNNYNADPYPDLFITGRDDFQNNNTLIYLNDSTGKFNLMETGIRPTNKSTASWFDFNVDGYVDAILPVMNSDDCVINLNYKNQYYYPFSTQIDTVVKGWFINHLNMDQDKDEDILISKAVTVPGPMGLFKYYTKVFINNGNLVNSAPLPPSYRTMFSEQDSMDIILRWEKGSDRQQDKNGLTYNLWVSSLDNNTIIVSPMADLTTGYNYFPKPGNVGGNNTWRIKNLPPGKYVWYLQSIDNSYQGSGWSKPRTFTVNDINIDFEYTKPCVGQAINFSNLTTSVASNIKSYTWDFGDGSIASTAVNPTHTYTLYNKDPYIIKLTVVTDSGDVAFITKPIQVLPSPVAKFLVPPVCLGSVTQFKNLSDTSQISVKSWLWDFGNGSSSIIRGNVTQAYIKNDTASLRIESFDGCVSSDTQTVIIGTYPESNLYLQDGHSKYLCQGDSSRIYIEPEPSLVYEWFKDSALIKNLNSNFFYVKHSGSYSVAAIDPVSKCFTMSKSIDFKVSASPSTPNISITLGDSVKCPADSIVIGISNTNNAYKYDWYKNGNLFKELNTSLAGYIENGEYFVKASVGNCFSNSRTILIQNKTAPAKPKISSNNGPDIYYMTCSNSTADVYRWYYNGTIIPNAQSHYIIIGKKLGTYYVEIEEQGKDCASRSDNITIPKDGIINNSVVEQSFELFPNPAQNLLNIKFSDTYCGTISVKITNVYGMIVYKELLDKSDPEYNKSIPLYNFKNGLYHITIEYNQQTISKSLIINK